MYLNRFFTFLNPHFTYISILAVNMLLAGCEDFSVNNKKPVFTISNMPSVAQQETTQINDVRPEFQVEETGLSEVEQEAPISEDTEKTRITSASEEASSVLENMPVKSSEKRQHRGKQNTDFIETDLESQGEASLLQEPLNTAENTDLIETDLESQGEAPLLLEPLDTAENTDLIETDLESLSEAPLLPEPLTITEIASLITTPPSIYITPPLERIKIRTLLSTDDVALNSIMGVPDFMLRTGQMQLWQYNVGGCIVDFFLKQSQFDYIVTFIEIRAKILGDTINEQTCDSELAQALNS